MLTAKNLQDLQMDSIENYFDWIKETTETGEMPNPYELLQPLNKRQKTELVNWCTENEQIHPATRGRIINLVISSYSRPKTI